MKANTVYFVGYAKLPSDIPAGEIFSSVALGIEVDMDSRVIVETSITLPTPLARRVVVSCVTGYNAETDLELIEKNIRIKYQGEAQKAIIVALRKAHSRYRSYSLPEVGNPQETNPRLP